MNKDIDWIILEKGAGEETEDGVIVRRANGETITVSTDNDGRMMFDGEFIDVHDDFMVFVATMDEIAERGWSEPYKE